MTLLQAALMGILQGLTEFLPVSSSGHLLMAQSLFGLKDLVALKSFDIAVHFGTLMAIFIYFAKDFWTLIKGFFRGVMGHKNEDFDMAVTLILATIPAILVGLLLGDWLDKIFYNAIAVPVMLILVGIVFLVAEKIHTKRGENREKITRKEGLMIGLAQTLALIPGVSRSGATISAGLMMGIERAKAARFSFLLGSIAMVAATAYAVLKVIKGDFLMPPTDILVVGIATSFLAGMAAIGFLMNYLRKHTLAVFAYYRLAAAVAFLIWFLLMMQQLGATLSNF